MTGEIRFARSIRLTYQILIIWPNNIIQYHIDINIHGIIKNLFIDHNKSIIKLRPLESQLLIEAKTVYSIEKVVLKLHTYQRITNSFSSGLRFSTFWRICYWWGNARQCFFQAKDWKRIHVKIMLGQMMKN